MQGTARRETKTRFILALRHTPHALHLPVSSPRRRRQTHHACVPPKVLRPPPPPRVFPSVHGYVVQRTRPCARFPVTPGPPAAGHPPTRRAGGSIHMHSGGEKGMHVPCRPPPIGPIISTPLAPLRALACAATQPRRRSTACTHSTASKPKRRRGPGLYS